VKRGGPVRRLTPLVRRAPLRARVSEPSELRKAKKIVKQRSGGKCEVRIPSVCSGRAIDRSSTPMALLFERSSANPIAFL
jgi:hypothetical protein